MTPKQGKISARRAPFPGKPSCLRSFFPLSIRFQRKEHTVNHARFLAAIALIVLAGVFASAVYAQQQPVKKRIALDPLATRLVGTWEVSHTKEPSQPYKASYRGQPFLRTGPNAFTLIMEYRKDGTFRRITRVGTSETIHDGTWKITGHELRHDRPGALEAEIMYLRFDGPDQYTSVDVYEGTPDPGLFGRFKRVK
jgi:hypothetical protein